VSSLTAPGGAVTCTLPSGEVRVPHSPTMISAELETRVGVAVDVGPPVAVAVRVGVTDSGVSVAVGVTPAVGLAVGCADRRTS